MKNSRFIGVLLFALATMAFGSAYAVDQSLAQSMLTFISTPEAAGTAAMSSLAFSMIGDTTSLGDIKSIIENQGRAFEEFKSTNDALVKAKADGKAVGDLEAKLAKIEKEGLAAGEAVSAKFVAAEAEAKQAKAAAAEAKAAVEELEVKLNRQGLGAVVNMKKHDVNVWARAVVDAHQKGIVNLSQAQQKALADVDAEYKSLSVSNDASGGYLAPSEYVKEIIKGVTEISPVRSLARVRATGAKSIMLPKRTGQFAAQRVVEQGARGETTGLAWGMLEIHAPEIFALIDISQQNLEDSAFDLEAEILFEATEQFAVAEGQEFVSGTGIGQMEGFLTNADVGITNSGAAATITADSLITLKHAVKTAYTRNANFVLNRTSLGAIRRLKDGDGNYLWMSGIAAGKPNTIDGDPYLELPDMPSEGANTKPVAYGDFMRGYSLVDRIAMSMLRDPFTQATSGNIRFLFRRRVGGGVTLPEAIRVLKCAV